MNGFVLKHHQHELKKMSAYAFASATKEEQGNNWSLQPQETQK